MKELKIKKADYVSGYKIKFTFSDKTEKEIDFSNFLKNSLHPEIRKYLDINRFKEFKIINGDIDWNDFDMCFPIHDLYTGQISVYSENDKQAAC